MTTRARFKRNLFVLALLGTAVLGYSRTRPFTIDLSADKSQVVMGSPVDLIVVMTNTSDHDVDCTSNYSNALDRNYVYDVKYEDGSPVPQIAESHGGYSSTPCVVEPGKSAKPGGGQISRLYDFSRPGKYLIQVSRARWGNENRPNTWGAGKSDQPSVKSNTITITVLPSDGKAN